MTTLPHLLTPAVLILTAASPLEAQTATISETVRVLETYPFSDPDPTAILIRDPRLYPYHGFDGYSHESEPLPWTVVTLENRHIEVFVLPEVGGKVWGARIKATGEEFLYRNEVLKFRNISLRGPWTSGGIEFNFGVIGHSPATATPVDHVLQEDEDGGVTCTVGSLDLPSRTPWRVQIHLPADSACFETRVLWYNPTPPEQPYYNWMTGAAVARDDLEFFVPGDQYLEHSGEAKPWPIDAEGHRLSVYDENRFEGHKSYHVVGRHAEFFGGYYHDDGFGFGHWAPYDEMPGQKLWLWALSREGGVWEELLTDTDGQYIEFQAGRLLVQYSPGSHLNPIRQAVFEPYRVDRWRERWFPVSGLGGMTAASEHGAMNVEREGDSLRVRLHSFAPKSGTLEVAIGDRAPIRRRLALAPLEARDETFAITGDEDWSVSVPELGLAESSRREELALKRPFATDSPGPAGLPEESAEDHHLGRARELARARRYRAAREEIDAALKERPRHRGALLALAELEYRRARYAEGLEAIRAVLQSDTYDPRANWIAGILYRAAGDLTNAKESLGWAARSMAYRAAGYAQLAEIALQERDAIRAARRARQALDYDRYGVNALQVLAITARLRGEKEAARAALRRLLELDPLHHFAYFEEYLLEGSGEALDRFRKRVGGELPDQTWLELAIGYVNRGREDDATLLLSARIAAENPLIELWLAYLGRERDPELAARLLSQAVERSPAFVFPYRRETLPVLEWARSRSDSWKLLYYLGLNCWALDRRAEAAHYFHIAGDEPDFGPFYAVRAHLGHELSGRDPEADLERAIELDPKGWKHTLRLIGHCQEKERWAEAEELAREARASFPGNFNLELAHSRALLRVGALDECIELLESVQVLPSEMGRVSRQLFEWAYLSRAIERIRAEQYEGAVSDLRRSLEWPEHLGQGRPYEPEERLQRFLLVHCYRKLGDEKAAGAEREALLGAPKDHPTGGSAPRILQILAMREEHSTPSSRAQQDREVIALAARGDTAPVWILARLWDDEASLAELRLEDPEFFGSYPLRLLDAALEATEGRR